MIPSVRELIARQQDGNLSFGNYILKEKKKQEDFSYNGDLYKVKTFSELTKLERNGLFVYESEPGSNVDDFIETDCGVEFTVEAASDLQITVGLYEDTEYEVFVDGASVGTMKTNMSGKLSVGLEFSDGHKSKVKIVKK